MSLCFFFFSSRRRHTRSYGDWSSDVCSSDLRRAMLADRLATQALDAITANTVSMGTGLIMLLAAGLLRGGSLTVGDFALFVSYLGFIADFTAGIGKFLAHYRQTGIAFARMSDLLGDAPPAALVEPA